MTCAHRPEVRKCSHSQDHSSPWSETLWEPLSPRNRISNSWKVIRWGSSAYRLAFSILEMRLAYNPRPPQLTRSDRTTTEPPYVAIRPRQRSIRLLISYRTTAHRSALTNHTQRN